jgi:HSP20 family protein
MANENNYCTFPLPVSDGAQRLLNDLIRQQWQCNRELRGWYPPVDFYENDDAFILEADLPGVEPRNVQVEIVDAELILRGRRVVRLSSADGRFHTMERLTGEFVRRLELPQSVSQEAIEVEFSDGVLHVIIPKIELETTQVAGGNMRSELWIKTISISLESEEPKSNGPSTILKMKDELSNLTPNGLTALPSNLG